MRLIRASRISAAVYMASVIVVLTAVLWGYLLPPSEHLNEPASNGLMLIGLVGGIAAFWTASAVLLQWLLEARAK